MFTFCTRRVTYLPNTNSGSSLSEWPLEIGYKLEGVATNLQNVVQEGQQTANWEGAGEHAHETELDEHLQVVLGSIVILKKNKSLLVIIYP